ncbi:hypothetical protein OIU78_020091 [Salix suchowensis]|nr:hypothetical protein OIU78_020091 [Salix suchowensis]
MVSMTLLKKTPASPLFCVAPEGPNSQNGLLDFRFEDIPDGLPHSDIDASQDVVALAEAIKNNLMAPFSDPLDKLNETAASNVTPLTCIVSDSLPFTHHRSC